MEQLDAAARGESRVVLLSGEPGVGKTRLLDEVAQRAARPGWQILVGQAFDSEGMPPYLPFVEALRVHVQACPLDDLRAQLGDGAQDVVLLLPEVGRRLSDLPAARQLEHENDGLLSRSRRRPMTRQMLCGTSVGPTCSEPRHWPAASNSRLSPPGSRRPRAQRTDFLPSRCTRRRLAAGAGRAAQTGQQ
jgi:hypothetical protein